MNVTDFIKKWRKPDSPNTQPPDPDDEAILEGPLALTLDRATSPGS